MRVLQVNCVYKSGSTGKIVYDLHSGYTSKGIESYVCYGRGPCVKEPNVIKTANDTVSRGYNLLSRITGSPYDGSRYATKRLIKVIENIEPDVVHLHCINGFFVNIYKLLDFLKRKKIKTVLTLHAEFMFTGSCGYALECDQWERELGCVKCDRLKEATGSVLLDRTHSNFQKMKKAFEGFDGDDLIIASVSPWLQERAERSAILKNYDHCSVLNGIDTEVFRYADPTALKKELKLENRKIVAFVTGLFIEFKGSKYIIELAKRMPDYTFLIIGNPSPITDVPPNVIPIGRLADGKMLALYYSLADVTVLLSKKETFSMVCAESLSCGTPIVGFYAGAPETISLPEYSIFCEYGDLDRLIEMLEKTMSCADTASKREIEAAAKKVYSKEQMATEYIKLYRQILKNE